MKRTDGSEAALRILHAWRCSGEQKCRILGVTEINAEQAELTEEQLQRVSHVLTIHAALRTIFINPDNVYGFITMKNNNAIFEGASPLELIQSGRLEELATVAHHGQSLAEGGW